MLKVVAVVSSLGLEVILFIVGGTWIGKKCDAIFDTEPFGLLLGLLIGIALGFVGVAYTIKLLLKE
nr:AtpZ/AtpI family protein [Polycladospora coralii]